MFQKGPFCFPLPRPIISSCANSVKKCWIEQNYHFFLFSDKRNYYSGEQHKFPGSKCQKQAQMQFVLGVKCMSCHPNFAVILQGFYMSCQTFIIT